MPEFKFSQLHTLAVTHEVDNSSQQCPTASWSVRIQCASHGGPGDSDASHGASGFELGPAADGGPTASGVVKDRDHRDTGNFKLN
jgi:hypothetical protein